MHFLPVFAKQVGQNTVSQWAGQSDRLLEARALKKVGTGNLESGQFLPQRPVRFSAADSLHFPGKCVTIPSNYDFYIYYWKKGLQ